MYIYIYIYVYIYIYIINMNINIQIHDNRKIRIIKLFRKELVYKKIFITRLNMMNFFFNLHDIKYGKSSMIRILKI